MHSLTLPPFHHFRSQDLWEDPLKYNPDRWSKAFHNDKVEGWKGFRPEKISGLYPDEQATDFAFLPFGGGARKVIVDGLGCALFVDCVRFGQCSFCVYHLSPFLPTSISLVFLLFSCFTMILVFTTSCFFFFFFFFFFLQCVGDQFAILEAASTFALMLRRFDFEFGPEGPGAVGLRTGATIHTQNGLWMRVRAREGVPRTGHEWVEPPHPVLNPGGTVLKQQLAHQLLQQETQHYSASAAAGHGGAAAKGAGAATSAAAEKTVS